MQDELLALQIQNERRKGELIKLKIMALKK